MPLLAEVILNTLKTVQGWHFLWSLARTWLAPCIVGWILMLDLTGRARCGVIYNFGIASSQLGLTLSSILEAVLRLSWILAGHSGWVFLASAQWVWILLRRRHPIKLLSISYSISFPVDYLLEFLSRYVVQKWVAIGHRAILYASFGNDIDWWFEFSQNLFISLSVKR